MHVQGAQEGQCAKVLPVVVAAHTWPLPGSVGSSQAL
jgi:hypothetical protein